MSVSSKFLSLWEKKAAECYDYAFSFLSKFEVAKDSIALVPCKSFKSEITEFTEEFLKKHEILFVQKVTKKEQMYQIICWNECTVKLKRKDLTDALDVLSNKVYEIMEQIDKAKDTCLALKNVHPLIVETIKECGISTITHNEYLFLTW